MKATLEKKEVTCKTAFPTSLWNLNCMDISYVMMKHYASLDFLTRCCCSVAQSCLAICNRMDCSTPGFPVIHHLQELAQTHVHWVGDAIQPSHSLSSLNPPAFNLSQQRFFERFFQSLLMSQLLGGQSIRASASESVLPKNIQDCFPLGLTGLISLQSKGLSRVFSNTTVQKYQFFGAQPCLYSNSHINTWLLEKP